MARPTWKGNISFGLVHIPVVLYSGEKRTDLSFHMLDSRDRARVRYERVNEITGEEVPWNEIVKAYEYDDGNYVILTEEDFAQAAIEATRTIEIEDFVELHAIELPFFEKPYVLEPMKSGQKAYALLREALRKSGKAGIAKVVIRTRQYLSAVIAQDEALLLVLLRFQSELRKESEFALPQKGAAPNNLTARELSMAEQLIETMTVAWDPSRYQDEYRESLLAWIEEKAANEGRTPAPAVPDEDSQPAGEIINIVDLLKESMKSSGRSTKPDADKKGGKKSTAEITRLVPQDKSSAGTKAKAKAKPKAKSKTKSAAKSEAKRKAR